MFMKVKTFFKVNMFFIHLQYRDPLVGVLQKCSFHKNCFMQAVRKYADIKITSRLVPVLKGQCHLFLLSFGIAKNTFVSMETSK